MRLFALSLAFVATFIHVTLAQVAKQNGMTADSYCGSGYCVTALYNPTSKSINYTMVVPKAGQSGWYGFAQGTRMSGANMAINWVNADKSVTTSHRSSVGHGDPQERLAQTNGNANGFSVNSGASRSTTTQSIWSWNMPVPSGASLNAVQHIYAYSANTPTSSSTSATLLRHSDDETGIKLDLTKAYTGAAPAGLAGATSTVNSTSGKSTMTSADDDDDDDDQKSSTGGQPSGRDLSKNINRVFLAHMLFMILGWLVCFPIGMIIARYGRTIFKWFPTHRLIQAVGVVFVFIGFFLGVGGIYSEGDDHLDNTHQRLGVALFILLIVQVILGALSHSLKKRKGNRIIGYMHIPFGILLVGLAVWEIHLGFEEWHWRPPKYASYIIYAWAALMGLIYVIGFALLPREIRQNREQRNDERQKAQQFDYDRPYSQA